MVRLNDTAPVSNVRKTKDGYLVADVRVARTGIQTYLGSEFGQPDRETIRVYRPPESVFDAESLKSYAHRPITLGHPPGNVVDSSNWKELSRGTTGDLVVRDGDFVRVPIMVMDADSISAVENGFAKELSMGYDADVQFKDGITPEGEAYDAVLSGLRMNHLAIVPKARGGSDLKIGDNKKEAPEMSDPKTRTILLDGLQVETTEAGAAALEKLQGLLKASTQKLADSETAHSAELAKRDAEIQKLKEAQLSDAQIDARVAARAALLDGARLLCPDLDVKGQDDKAIRRMTVHKLFGDAATKGKDDTYIEARFDIALGDAQAAKMKDPIKQGLSDNKSTPAQGDAADAAYTAHVQQMSDAWKSDTNKKEA